MVFASDKKIKILKKEHQSLSNDYKQLIEEFSDYRKSIFLNEDKLINQIIIKSLQPLLKIVDEFEIRRRGFYPEYEDAQTIHSAYQGLYAQLAEVFKQQGVRPMEVLGQPFDPHSHEAVFYEPSDIYEEDIISEEIVRGFYIDNKVLRYAQVKVSSGPSESQLSLF